MIMRLILVFLVLFIVPLFVGNGVCAHLKIEQRFTTNYVVGWISIWALFQLVSVPLILRKQSFSMLVGLITALIGCFLLYCIYFKKFQKYERREKTKKEWILQIVMILLFGVFLVFNIMVQHTDADDSRFVVNAVDMVRTDRMFLTNPATGEVINTWLWELGKDVISPWAVSIAYFAKVTGIKPVIIAHTFMAIVLIMVAILTYKLLADIFFDGDETSKYIFVFFAVLVNVYGYYSVYGSETFLLTRIWQGKAVVSSIGVSLIVWICLNIFCKPEKKENYVICLILQLALCLMSGMGIIIGCVLVNCFGFIYGVIEKDLRITIKLGLTTIPNVIYAGMSFLI